MGWSTTVKNLPALLAGKRNVEVRDESGTDRGGHSRRGRVIVIVEVVCDRERRSQRRSRRGSLSLIVAGGTKLQHSGVRGLGVLERLGRVGPNTTTVPAEEAQ